MIRILALLLALTIGAPASALAGSDVPTGVDLLGSGCCFAKSTSDSRHQDDQLVKACCCSPSPVSAGAEIPQLGPTSNSPLLAAARSSAVTDIAEAKATPAPLAPKAGQARPPPWSLLAQHTSLLL